MDQKRMKDLVVQFIVKKHPSPERSALLDEMVRRLLSGSETLQATVVLLEKQLTGNDTELRFRAMHLISELLTHSAGLKLPAQHIFFFGKFFCDRLQDDVCVSECLTALQGLSKLGNGLPADVCRQFAATVFQFVTIQDLQFVHRMSFFELITELLGTTVGGDAFRSLGADFVYMFLQSLDGEMDPRCLIHAFPVMKHLIEFDGWERFAEEMFGVLSSYFPLVFTPPPDSPANVTEEELQRLLKEAMLASSVYTRHALAFFLDRLVGTSEMTKVMALDHLTTAAATFPVANFAPRIEMLFDGLKVELLQSSRPKVQDAALSCLKTVLMRMASSEVGAKALTSVTVQIVREVTQRVEAVEDGQLLGNLAPLLETTMISSDRALKYVVQSALPSLLHAFERAVRISKQQAVLHLIACIIHACRVSATQTDVTRSTPTSTKKTTTDAVVDQEDISMREVSELPVSPLAPLADRLIDLCLEPMMGRGKWALHADAAAALGDMASIGLRHQSLYSPGQVKRAIRGLVSVLIGSTDTKDKADKLAVCQHSLLAFLPNYSDDVVKEGVPLLIFAVRKAIGGIGSSASAPSTSTSTAPTLLDQLDQSDPEMVTPLPLLLIGSLKVLCQHARGLFVAMVRELVQMLVQVPHWVVAASIASCVSGSYEAVEHGAALAADSGLATACRTTLAPVLVVVGASACCAVSMPTDDESGDDDATMSNAELPPYLRDSTAPKDRITDRALTWLADALHTITLGCPVDGSTNANVESDVSSQHTLMSMVMGLFVKGELPSLDMSQASESTPDVQLVSPDVSKQLAHPLLAKMIRQEFHPLALSHLEQTRTLQLFCGVVNPLQPAVIAAVLNTDQKQELCQALARIAAATVKLPGDTENAWAEEKRRRISAPSGPDRAAEATQFGLDGPVAIGASSSTSAQPTAKPTPTHQAIPATTLRRAAVLCIAGLVNKTCGRDAAGAWTLSQNLMTQCSSLAEGLAAAADDESASVSDSALKLSRTRAMCIPGELYAGVVKALLMAKHEQADTALGMLLCTLQAPGDDSATSLLAQALSDAIPLLLANFTTGLTTQSHALVDPDYQQHIFESVLPALLKGISQGEPSDESLRKQAHLSITALGGLLRETSSDILVPKLPDLFQYIQQGLEGTATAATETMIDTLVAIVPDARDYLAQRARDCTLPLLRHATTGPTTQVRIQALQALRLLASPEGLPHSSLYEMKRVVFEQLNSAVDDRRRAIRREGRYTRNAWGMVDQSKETLH